MGLKFLCLLVLFLSSLSACFAQIDCSGLENPSLIPNGSYVPLGEVVMAAGMDTYITGSSNASKIIIGVYDIYGFSPSTNIWQICDKIASNGYKVVLPDFFHGEPWKREHYPYPTDQEFYDFVKSTSWEASVREDLGKVLTHFKSENFTEFGIFGFCFGGGISARAVDEYGEDIKIAAQFHPAGVNISHAYVIKSPTILLPGANDPDMTEYCEIINTNLGEGSCSYTHFTDVNHGFAGGRADWNNGTVRGRAEEAVGLFQKFLCQKFPSN